MSARLPDTMAGYMTYELAEQLRGLTPQQRAGIARIVEHVYILNRPMAELMTGDNAVVSENVYYRRGVLNEETGQWSRVGWSHQKAFTEALAHAARLALSAREKEELHAVREAVRRARLAAAPIMGGLVGLAQSSEQDKDRIAASKMVLDIAIKHTEFDSTGAGTDNEAADWWAAGEEDE